MKFVRNIWPGLLLLLFSFVISISTYQDYGVGSDEDGQSLIGERFYRYAFEGDPTFSTYIERDHGAGFELPLKIIEKKCHITDSRDVLLMRHLLSHFFFLLCMFAGYILVLRLFDSQWLACLAFVVLVFHPRLYTQSYFNSKDIPAMGTFLVAIAASRWAFVKDRSWAFLLLGIICGYSASIRLMNIIILCPLGIFILVDLFSCWRQGKKAITTKLVNGIALLAGFSLTLYICWPTLWVAPVKSIIDVFQTLSVFRWPGSVLFGGNIMLATNIPWNYIPTWLMLTTPELWVILGIVGAIFIIARMILRPRQYFFNTPERNFVLALFCFVAPIIVVVILNSVLYDDWRHLYFIYPAFVLLIIYALSVLIKRKYKFVVWGACLLQLAMVARFMYRSHPYQYVYFNHFISHEPEYISKKYEMDYWGVSNKNALDWILRHSPDDSIMINDAWLVGFARTFLPASQRERFILTSDINKVEYYIENFRTYPLRFGYRPYPHGKDIYVQNSTILRITRLR